MHAPSPTKSQIGEREFVWLLSLLMALNGFAVDTMLPAFPQMARDLGVDGTNKIQFVISSYLIGTAIGSLIHGPLSDRFGRKPLLMASLAGYLLFSLLSGFAGSFEMLIAMRFAHGLCGGGLGVLGSAVVRDRFSGDAMARIMSLTFLIFMVVPVLAPSIGQLVLWITHWRAIYWLFVGAGAIIASWVWMRLPETLDPKNQIPFEPAKLLSAWKTVLKHRQGVCYTLAGGIVQGAMFGFLNSCQQVIGISFGAANIFTLCVAIMGVGMGAANFTNSKIVMRFGARRVSHSANILFIGMGLVQLAGHWFAPHSLALFMVLLIGNMSLAAFIGSNFSSIAMQPFGAVAGAASSFQGFFRMLLSAGIGAFIGQQFNGTSVPVSLGFLGCGTAALLIILFAERGKLFTRPGTTQHQPLA